MARHKPTAKKRRLAKKTRQRQAVPTWVIAKTKGRVRNNPKRGHWTRTKIRA